MWRANSTTARCSTLRSLPPHRRSNTTRSRYGALIAWAKELGRDDCASVLQKNLEEEKAADRKLSLMAETGVNASAAAV
jgi:hypothetical protein